MVHNDGFSIYWSEHVRLEFTLSCHDKEIILFTATDKEIILCTIDPYYGDLN